MSSSDTTHGPPYASSIALLGGIPSTTVDDPITAIFLVLFICGAACHMTIFQLNKRRSHKFLASGALFGMCMARTLTCVLRLAWSTHQANVHLAIAATIFVNAGVIIVIVINIVFAQRLLRATYPRIGWHPIVSKAFLVYFASIPLNLAVVITAIVQQSYTLDPYIRDIDHKMLLFGGTYTAFASFLPILIILAISLPLKRGYNDEFGAGRHQSKVYILLLASTLICLGACFRAGTSFLPRPAAHPAWYHSKACFYCFTLLLEIIVLFLYVWVRVDRRFHIPDGANGTYGPGQAEHDVIGPLSKEDLFHIGDDGRKINTSGLRKVAIGK